MATLNQMPALNSQKGFSMHDLSHYFGFKCSTGHIVPLECDILNPNERVRLKADMYVRMQPLVTPAMVDIDVDIHYFFVPMQMLDINFGRKWSQTKELFTSMVSNSAQSEINKNLFRFSVSDTFVNYRRSTIYNSDALKNYTSSNSLECAGSRIFRLLDYFGLNPYVSLKGSARTFDTDADDNVTAIDDYGSEFTSKNDYGNTFDPYLFVYQILAYNAIWEYWYRLEDRDTFDNSLFNLDKLNSANSMNWQVKNLFGGDSQQYGKQIDMFGIKYCPQRKDYFTSSFRAPVINGLNFLQGNTDALFNMLPNINNNSQYLSNNSSYFVESVGHWDGLINNGAPTDIISDTVSSNFSTQQLRLMQAKEKYMNILGRLPRKNYDNLVYALFGENVPHDIKHELSHLGHDHFTINIGQVMSTASTEGAPLGELAGTGVGSSKSRGVKFTAPVHGVIMALASISPRRMYLGGFLRHNFITSLNDFYNPVYDNLGMQPIFGFEINSDYKAGAAEVASIYDSIIGWQFRYEQFKRRYDRVNRAFGFGNEKAWFNTSDLLRFNGYEDLVDDDSNIDNGLQPLLTVSNDFFYTRPDSLNNVMLVQYSTDWIEQWLTAERRQSIPNLKQSELENWYLNPALIYSRDPFICLSHIDYTKFSKMSDYGLVRFD